MSSSRRSNLTSERRRNTKHCSRKRLLRREASYQPFSGEHIKYVWAAYKRGQFPVVPGELTPDEFRLYVADWVAAFMEAGGDWFILEAKTKYGKIPVGITSVRVEEGDDTVKQMTPHVIWFPEASARNKLECAVKFITDLRKEGHIVTIARQQDWRFFSALANYGIIRPVGKLWKHYKDGSDAMIYQSVR